MAKNLVYRTVQFLRREPVFSKLRELERTQWLERGRLDEFVIRRLSGILTVAYETTEFYRERFDSCGFDPYKFRHPDELLQIPLLTKREIQEHYPRIVSKAHKGPFLTASTSGSTGTPFTFYVDHAAAAAQRAAQYRGRRWAGLDIGSREARFYVMPRDPRARLKAQIVDGLMNRVRYSALEMSDASMGRYWERIRRQRPEYVYGYVSAVSRFSDYLRRNGIVPPFRVTAVITTAEVLHQSERQLIEEVWRTKVFNEYGCSELNVIASECSHGSMHLVNDNVFVEFLHNRMPAAEGEPAEVVLTDLDNRKMPFIRYRIGDVASFSRQRCPCGRGLPLMNLVDGRLNGMVLTPEGNVLVGGVFYSMYKNVPSLVEARAHQKAIDHIHFLIQKREAFSDADVETLRAEVRKHLGPSMQMTYEFVDEIPPLPSGKIVPFVTELPVDVAGTQYRIRRANEQPTAVATQQDDRPA